MTSLTKRINDELKKQNLEMATMSTLNSSTCTIAVVDGEAIKVWAVPFSAKKRNYYEYALKVFNTCLNIFIMYFKAFCVFGLIDMATQSLTNSKVKPMHLLLVFLFEGGGWPVLLLASAFTVALIVFISQRTHNTL